MHALALIPVSALVLTLVPGRAFSPRGFRSLGGISSFIGHATLAATPAGLWAWSDRHAPPEGLIGLAVGGGIVALALLFTNVIVRSIPAPAPAPAPRTAQAEPMPDAEPQA